MSPGPPTHTSGWLCQASCGTASCATSMMAMQQAHILHTRTLTCMAPPVTAAWRTNIVPGVWWCYSTCGHLIITNSLVTTSVSHVETLRQCVTSRPLLLKQLVSLAILDKNPGGAAGGCLRHRNIGDMEPAPLASWCARPRMDSE